MRWLSAGRNVYRGLKQLRIRYVVALLVFVAVFINLTLFRSVLDFKSAREDSPSHVWGQPGLRDEYWLFEGIHDRSWVANIQKNLHLNISREQINLSSQIKSVLSQTQNQLKHNSSKVVKIMEAAALERLACIETRSQELKKMLKTRAVQKSLEDLESSSSHHGNINSQSANESPRCVSGNGVSLEPENKKKPDYIEGARPGLMDSYPERNFQRFCTDNVRLIRPSDFVTVGHIKPNIHLAIGVPTVSRPQESYFVNTLNDLFMKASSDEMKDVAIIVFLADLGSDVIQKQLVKEQLLKAFPKEVKAGNLVVIEAPAEFYPPLVNLKRNFNDAPSRVYWRAKQCIDFSFIFSFAHNISRYYLHLEDDVITKKGYITAIKNSAKHLKGQFFEMEFSVLGFIAKMFRSADLLDLAAFHFYYHEEMPVDFLQPIYLKMTSPDHSVPVPHYPSLFQHKGKGSSLKGKKSTIQDPFFDSYRMFMFKSTVGFNAYTNIQYSATHRPEMSLSGAGMYWSKVAPKPKDHFTIWSDSQQFAEYMVIVSGNPKHPNDTAIGAKVEVSGTLVERTRTSATCKEPYKEIGVFEHAVFALNMTYVGEFECVRIVFTKQSQHWLLISEIVFAKPNEYMMIRNLSDHPDQYVHLPSFLRTRYELYVNRGFRYI